MWPTVAIFEVVMKIISITVLGLSLLTLSLTPAIAAQSLSYSHSAAMADLAPADEYFGPLKMSILGIGNALNNIKRRLNGADMSDDTLNSLAQVQNSIKDWESKYPRDPWLSRSLLALHHTYAMFHDDRAKAMASRTAAWIIAKYAGSKEAASLSSS